MGENKITILIVDDDQNIRELLRDLLEVEGFRVCEAACGRDAVAHMSEAIDFVILDVAMPGEDGFMTCRKLREISMVPILFLTAKSQDEDKQEGFQAGGDDYLPKPFSKVELLSRIRALLRRCYEYKVPRKENPSSKIVRGDLEMDVESREVRVKEKPVSLTQTEYDLLEVMMRYPGKVFSAQNLYESVWKQTYTFADNNILIVHISNLRKKLGDNTKNPVYIRNMWGRGYYVD